MQAQSESATGSSQEISDGELKNLQECLENWFKIFESKIQGSSEVINKFFEKNHNSLKVFIESTGAGLPSGNALMQAQAEAKQQNSTDKMYLHLLCEELPMG